jgi:hypothetical protein
MKTIPYQALRERHLKSALSHIFQAIAYTEALELANRDNTDIDQLYTDRGDLKHVALIVDSIIGCA